MVQDPVALSRAKKNLESNLVKFFPITSPPPALGTSSGCFFSVILDAMVFARLRPNFPKTHPITKRPIVLSHSSTTDAMKLRDIAAQLILFTDHYIRNDETHRITHLIPGRTSLKDYANHLLLPTTPACEVAIMYSASVLNVSVVIVSDSPGYEGIQLFTPKKSIWCCSTLEEILEPDFIEEKRLDPDRIVYLTYNGHSKQHGWVEI